jgi:hypothetical protein
VGQVVETIGQYRGTAYHKKTWYYIPIDRILQDGELDLLLGDFSDNSNE